MKEMEGHRSASDHPGRPKTPTRGEDRWEKVEDEDGKRAKKKIKIAQIDDKRGRQTTFTKRKQGLMKKARELSVLCGCDIAILMTNLQGKLLQFDTGNIDSLVSKYHDEGAAERYGLRETPTECGQSITPTASGSHLYSTSTDGKESVQPGMSVKMEGHQPSSMVMLDSEPAAPGQGMHGAGSFLDYMGHGSGAGPYSDAAAGMWPAHQQSSQNQGSGRDHNATHNPFQTAPPGFGSGAMGQESEAVHRQTQGMAQVWPHAVHAGGNMGQHQTLAQAQARAQQQQQHQQQRMRGMLPDAHFHALSAPGQPLSGPQGTANLNQPNPGGPGAQAPSSSYPQSTHYPGAAAQQPGSSDAQEASQGFQGGGLEEASEYAGGGVGMGGGGGGGWHVPGPQAGRAHGQGGGVAGVASMAGGQMGPQSWQGMPAHGSPLHTMPARAGVSVHVSDLPQGPHAAWGDRDLSAGSGAGFNLNEPHWQDIHPGRRRAASARPGPFSSQPPAHWQAPARSRGQQQQQVEHVQVGILPSTVRVGHPSLSGSRVAPPSGAQEAVKGGQGPQMMRYGPGADGSGAGVTLPSQDVGEDPLLGRPALGAWQCA